MRVLYGTARRRDLELLNLRPGEKVLIPGVGTGLDLPLIPAGIRVSGIDLSPVMPEKAGAKSRDLCIGGLGAFIALGILFAGIARGIRRP